MSDSRCPNCGNRVLQKSGAGAKLRTQGPILIDESGTCRAQCFWCRTEIALPIAPTFSKSMLQEPDPNARFVIRPKRNT